MAALFGYPPFDAADRLRWTQRSEPRWTLTGDDVAKLRERARGRVDFESRPSVPPLEADPEELARRLSHVEAALVRTRSRRAVRLADAVRGCSAADRGQTSRPSGERFATRSREPDRLRLGAVGLPASSRVSGAGAHRRPLEVDPVQIR